MNYSEWPAIVADLFARLSQSVSTYFPNMVGAITLVAIGWVAAKLLRITVARLVSRLNRLIQGRAFGREMKSAGVDEMASEVVAGVVFWAVLLFFVAASMEALGLAVVTSALGRLAGYLPTVLAALLVILAGLVAGNLGYSVVSKTASSANISYADALGKAVKAAIWLLAGVVALDQVGIDSTVLIVVTAIVIGVVLGGFALAFGLGARTVVGNMLATHYLSQIYRPGQTVRVSGVQGRVVEIQPTGVLIETAEGRALVPAGMFFESTSVLLLGGGQE